MVGSADITFSGAGSSDDINIDIPTGFTIDSAIMPDGSNAGDVLWNDATVRKTGQLIKLSSNDGFQLALESSGQANNLLHGDELASGDLIHIEFKVPIVGFDSGAIISTAQANVTTLKVLANTQTATTMTTGVSTTIPYGTILEDNFNAYNSSTGVFTSPVKQTYLLIAGATLASSSSFSDGEVIQLRLKKNGSFDRMIQRIEFETANAGIFGSVYGSTMITLDADDTMEVAIFQDSGANINLLTGEVKTPVEPL